VELDTLRSSIIPNLVEGAKSNLLRSVKSGSLFEVGPVARAVKGTVVEETNITGMRFGFKSRKNWRAKDAAFDFFDIKADTEAVLSELGLIDLTFAAPKEAVAGFHPARSAVISFAGTPVGMCGQLHPEYCKAHDIGLDAFVFEISLTTVLRLREAGTNPSVRFQPSDLLPVERDLSLLLDTKVEVGAVQKLIATKLGAQFISVNVFDVFEGSKLPEGKRAVGFTMLIRQGSTAFTSAQLDEICRGVIDEVRSKFGAELRQ
jgi:phenylalanyl-tRNA synthetase beta chain